MFYFLNITWSKLRDIDKRAGLKDTLWLTIEDTCVNRNHNMRPRICKEVCFVQNNDTYTKDNFVLNWSSTHAG